MKRGDKPRIEFIRFKRSQLRVWEGREALETKLCSQCGAMCTMDHKAKSYKCPRCGVEEPMNEASVIHRENKEADKIIVIGKKEQSIKTMSQVKMQCPKCDNSMAYWWMVQTRSIDESMTQFYRCTKCNYTWRDYS